MNGELECVAGGASDVKAGDFGAHCAESCDEGGCGDEECRQDEGD